MQELRQQAQEYFKKVPMPKERDEAWRHTKIDFFKLEEFPEFSAPKIELSQLPAELQEKGVVFCDLNTAAKEHTGILSKHFLKNIDLHDKFLALNASTWKNGYFLYLPKNVEIKNPLKASITVIDTSSTHNVVIAEPNSKVEFIEEYSSNNDQEVMSSCTTEVFADSSSQIDFYHLNHFKRNVSSFNHTIGTIKKDATLNWVSGSFGGKLNRLRIDTHFKEEGAASENLGIFIGKNKEHIDVTTNVHHHAQNTTNNIKMDGIMKDQSTSIYRGLIKITNKGKLTSSFLANNVLKLSDKAVANSIPALEIDTNDVKASHGATIGQIDEEQLFYLTSRGLTREEAENLVVEGFFEPIISKIPLKSVQEHFRKIVRVGG